MIRRSGLPSVPHAAEYDSCQIRPGVIAPRSGTAHASEILPAAAVEVLNLLPEGYRARITREANDLHRCSKRIRSAYVRNSMSDMHDCDKAAAPCAINPDRHITVPAAECQASYKEHLPVEIDFGARFWPNALPERIPSGFRTDHRGCLAAQMRLVKPRSDFVPARQRLGFYQLFSCRTFP
jgi:hypothetical protein